MSYYLITKKILKNEQKCIDYRSYCLAALQGIFFVEQAEGDLVYDYADCIRDCESEHSNQLTSIRQAYDQCFDSALNDLKETLRNCPCGNPLKTTLYCL